MTGFTFDDPADFDRRAGLPAATQREVAAAIAELAGDRGPVVDVGAGSGEIGSDLARGRYAYLGVDASLAMLAVFRHKLGGAAGAVLVRADADRPWPVASGGAKVVFLSRSAHLLCGEHLVDEALRVADPRGASLVLGSVRRERDSLRAELRREMRRLLAEHGVTGRSGRGAKSRIAAAVAERGGRALPPRTAATWPVVERAGDSLAAWRRKSGLAGKAVPAAIRAIVLDRLGVWARRRYGSLDFTREATESYELTVIRLPPVRQH